MNTYLLTHLGSAAFLITTRKYLCSVRLNKASAYQGYRSYSKIKSIYKLLCYVQY